MNKRLLLALLTVCNVFLLQAADEPLVEDAQRLQEFKNQIRDKINETCSSTLYGGYNIRLVKQCMTLDKNILKHERARKDNAYLAMLKLAALHEMAREIKLAESWYMKAADTGNPFAIFQCGYFYERAQNYELAKECYEDASTKGSDDATISMGKLFEKERDFFSALLWYEKTADKNRYAMFKTGLMQERLGYDVAANRSFEHAANQGHLQSMLKCGYYAEHTDDLAGRLHWFELAGKNGSAEAYCRLGRYYQDNGNNNLAEKYFISAAKLGHVGAMHELDIIHIKKNFKPGDLNAKVFLGMLQ